MRIHGYHESEPIPGESYLANEVRRERERETERQISSRLVGPMGGWVDQERVSERW